MARREKQSPQNWNPSRVGTDEDGDTITSCVVVETDQATATRPKAQGSHLINQPCSLFYTRQQAADSEEWTEQAKEAGLSFNRAATYWDLRRALQDKGLVYEGVNGWLPK